MSANRSQRLTPIAKLAGQDGQRAAAVLSASRGVLVDQQARLEQLYAYREDYLRRLAELRATGMGAHQLKDFRVFLQRLEDGIADARGRLEDARKDVHGHEQVWQSKRTHSLALEKVIHRRRGEEQRSRRRQDQRRADDLSQVPRTNPAFGRGTDPET